MSKTRTNHVTLFSNGMGHFVRHYTVRAGQQEKISIPFKRDDMDQVLASLAVFGNVKYDSPPSFTPTNSNATSLDIDRTDAGRSLLKSLSGAKVIIDGACINKESAKLLGIETVASVVNNEVVHQDFVVVDLNGEIRSYARSAISGITFVEESVRAEIDKALQNNFQRIKPDSSFLDLSLSSIPQDNQDSPVDEDAEVQYAVPVAAWKMRYSIRQKGDRFTLEGAAVIDNNSDEDWNDFVVSVVTGNPISFRTDLAVVTVPKRDFVRLVDDQVLGNVNVEHDTRSIGVAARSKGVVRGAAAYASNLAGASFGMMEAAYRSDEDFSEGEYESAPAAAAPGVESKEVGDFCIFTSKEPISIASKRSAIVPMFTVALNTGSSVLLYKEEEHARRPYRAVRFKNETDYSLGKGKVVVYQDGIFSGESVLQAAKPGDNRMLPHCLENGVKIVKELKKHDRREFSLRFSQGVAYNETISRAVTEYEIENKKDQEFKVLVEHKNYLGNKDVPKFSGVEVDDVEKLPSGTYGDYRATFTLKPGKSVILQVTEQYIETSQVNLFNNYRYIDSRIFQNKHALSQNVHIRKLAEIQTEIDKVKTAIQRLDTRKAELEAQSDRVGKNVERAENLTKGNDNSSLLLNEWMEDLHQTEKEIRKIDKDVRPALVAQLDTHQDDLNHELKQLSVTWQSPSEDEANVVLS